MAERFLKVVGKKRSPFVSANKSTEIRIAMTIRKILLILRGFDGVKSKEKLWLKA